MKQASAAHTSHLTLVKQHESGVDGKLIRVRKTAFEKREFLRCFELGTCCIFFKSIYNHWPGQDLRVFAVREVVRGRAGCEGGFFFKQALSSKEI